MRVRFGWAMKSNSKIRNRAALAASIRLWNIDFLEAQASKFPF